MLTIRSTHLPADDYGHGARIRATATHGGRRRSLTISYPFDGPDAGGSETYAIPAARLASRIVGRNVGPSELDVIPDAGGSASYVYAFDDTRPVDPDAPVLGEISRQYGAAGAVAYSVHVRYPQDGDDGARVTFTGSTYGGPVVMVTPGNPGGTFVTSPERFGTFGESWVRRFFGGAA